jgi:menaquinone-dependent protoporphyrinogen oxidase
MQSSVIPVTGSAARSCHNGARGIAAAAPVLHPFTSRSAIRRCALKGIPLMTAPVLVTWATRYGSTEEVALQIASVLREKGVGVDAYPMRDARRLESYEAIVLGAALYIGRLHRDARHFLDAHREELRARRVALFVLGPIHAEEGEFTVARNQLRRQMGKYPWLAPVTQQVFGGRWDPAKLGFPLSWLPATRGVEASDARDWAAIRAWAGSLPGRLLVSPVAA